MKIKFIDGEKLYYAFYYGKKEVLKRRKILNKINVFPVPDGDTGTNLAITLQSIFDGTRMTPHVSDVSRGMADAALTGSRGNSGIIFAQFIQGLSTAIHDKAHISPKEFTHAVRVGVDHAYTALKKPVEGTILTVMKAWSNALSHCHLHVGDFHELLSRSMGAAKTALKETPKKLKVLEKAGVVDAGAQGFVHFLEGMSHFIHHGKKPDLVNDHVPHIEEEDLHIFALDQDVEYRYCTESIVKGEDLKPDALRSSLSKHGDSLIVAGSDRRVKVHIHSNQPSEVFSDLRQYGTILSPKVDDMLVQRDVQFHRISNVAVVTDSACDIPADLMDKHQIHMVPLYVNFGESQYLDKLAIEPKQFYGMLDDAVDYPKTSQPTVQAFEKMYHSLLDHYDRIVSIHLSSPLSGTWNAAYQAAQKFPAEKIEVVDSKTLSICLGQVVLEVAKAVTDGMGFDEAVGLARGLRERARVLVSVKSLKYLVRGGRVSPLKGFAAKAMNLKPIISVDKEGKTQFYGKAYSERSNQKKIVQLVEKAHGETPIRSYVIGHASNPDGARAFGEAIEAKVGIRPEYYIDISPVIGAHVGVGALGVSFIQ